MNRQDSIEAALYLIICTAMMQLIDPPNDQWPLMFSMSTVISCCAAQYLFKHLWFSDRELGLVDDPDFRAFVESLPDSHWSKYDLSAVRLGWDANNESRH